MSGKGLVPGASPEDVKSLIKDIPLSDRASVAHAIGVAESRAGFFSKLVNMLISLTENSTLGVQRAEQANQTNRGLLSAMLQAIQLKIGSNSEYSGEIDKMIKQLSYTAGESDLNIFRLKKSAIEQAGKLCVELFENLDSHTDDEIKKALDKIKSLVDFSNAKK